MDDLHKNIQGAINSLDGIQRPELSPLMADRIWKQAQESQGKENTEGLNLSKTWLWLSCLAAVVVLNIVFLNWSAHSSLNYEQSDSSITNIYFDSEISY